MISWWAKISFWGFTSLEKSFAVLLKKSPKGKNHIKKELSACVEEYFNGFYIAERLSETERGHIYKPIDTVYKPVSKINQIVNCYFTKFMRNAYRVLNPMRNANRVLNQKKERACPRQQTSVMLVTDFL